MTSNIPRLLIVEDENHLATGLKLNFQLEGFAVDLAESARKAGAFLLHTHAYKVIILDVMLPDLDGFSLCRQLRDAGNYTPIIMLTARNSAEDRVAGLEAGADDYIAKPFELNELIARVRSLLRRRHWDQSSLTSPNNSNEEFLSFGETQVNFATHEIISNEREIHLTKLEFDLLRYFAKNEGRVLSRSELLKQVWKLGNYSNTRTVDNFIARLRKHFEPDPADPIFFVSVRGAGYRFLPSPK